MKRREFLTTAALGAGGAAALAAPAIAQSQPEIRWRLTSSFPKTLDVIYGSGELFARTVAELTEGRFQITSFGAGELVPGLQALDAVQNATVECAHTPTYYYIGKDTAFAFGTGLPFGFNARQQNAWLNVGGGNELVQALHTPYNVLALPCGNSGAQMGGWFRKEVRSPQDLAGLKMRVGGFGGRVLARLGVVPQQLAAGDVYPALERGSLDAVELIGPYDDDKTGFVRIAPYYYYPGFWEGGATLHLYVNLAKFNELPKLYQAAIRTAASVANEHMLNLYDLRNAQAIRRLVAQGAQLKPFSREIMDAAYKTTFELYDELARENPNWKRIYEPWTAFRNESTLWFRVAEQSYYTYVYGQLAKG